MEGLRLEPMTRDRAVAVRTWRYPPPYDIYDMTRATVEELVDPSAGFFAVMSGDELVGFRSFGADGQVPGWDYDDIALDTGGGLRPDLVGRGLGRTVLQAGLDHGRLVYRPRAFRITVAAFNARARSVVRSLGFEQVGSFEALLDARPFAVMVRPETGLRS